VTTYLSFEITRVRSGYLARRRTLEAIWQLGPCKTMCSLMNKIEEHYAAEGVEEWWAR
jgi:hypothetical protein